MGTPSGRDVRKKCEISDEKSCKQQMNLTMERIHILCKLKAHIEFHAFLGLHLLWSCVCFHVQYSPSETQCLLRPSPLFKNNNVCYAIFIGRVELI